MSGGVKDQAKLRAKLRREAGTPDKRQSRCTSCSKCLLHIARQPLKCVEFDPFRDVLASVSR